MQTRVILIIIFICLGVIFFVIPFIKRIYRNYLLDKIAYCIQLNDKNSFNALLQSKITKWCIPKYNQAYLNLSFYISSNDIDGVYKQFHLMKSYKMSVKQKEDLYIKVFEFFVFRECKKYSYDLLEYIKGMNNSQLSRKSEILYDILIEKKSNYINLLEKMLHKEQNNQKKWILMYLLSEQYKNKNNQEKSLYYQDKMKALSFSKGEVMNDKNSVL